jgi:hypothetical protein
VQTGDTIPSVLCAAGYIIRWLLRMIRKKGTSLVADHPGTAIGNMSPSYSVIGNNQTAFRPPNSDQNSIRLIKPNFLGTTNDN